MVRIKRIFSIAIAVSLLMGSQVSAQRRGRSSPRFSLNALQIGDMLPDITVFDSEGKELPLRSLKEHYTVLVFGCLT